MKRERNRDDERGKEKRRREWKRVQREDGSGWERRNTEEMLQ